MLYKGFFPMKCSEGVVVWAKQAIYTRFSRLLFSFTMLLLCFPSGRMIHKFVCSLVSMNAM
jgi:hypothetical protein